MGRVTMDEYMYTPGTTLDNIWCPFCTSDKLEWRRMPRLNKLEAICPNKGCLEVFSTTELNTIALVELAAAAYEIYGRMVNGGRL